MEDAFDGAGVAVVGNAELLGGCVAAGAGLDFSAHGEVEGFLALAGVAAGFGVAAGAHHGDSERGDEIAQGGGFARAEDDSNGGEGHSQGAEELDELAVGQGIFRLKLSGGGAQAREADGELGFPADALEVFEVGCEGEGFESPIGEAEKRADADAAEARLVAALRAIEPPVEILLWPGEVHPRVGLAVVCLLINNQALGSGCHERSVVGSLHRRDLDRERGHERTQALEAHFDVGAGDEFRVLAGYEKDVAKTFLDEVPGFLFDLVDFEGDALDGVLTGEATVGAGVDALVRKVERGEEPHRPAEMASGGGGGAGGELLERGVIHRLQQRFEAPQERRLLPYCIVENLGKTHHIVRARRVPHLIDEPARDRKRRFGFSPLVLLFGMELEDAGDLFDGLRMLVRGVVRRDDFFGDRRGDV